MATLHFDAQCSAELICQPQRFQLSCLKARERLNQLIKNRPGIQIRDTIEAQLRDLIRTRHADRKLSVGELDQLTTAHLGTVSPVHYGTWFYYPWSNYLIHLLDEVEFVELRTNRNLYKISHEERRRLATKRIGVVGLSVGHAVALTIALERSCGELRLADFDVLDLSNLNRVRTGAHNIGLPKVYVTAREIAEIDPYLQVSCFPAGVTTGNCDEFLLGGAPLDVVIEECDSIDVKVMLRERARLHRIPVVMDTCDGGMLDIERFDLEPERPIFHGLAKGLVAGALHGLTTEEKIPYVLAILGVERLSPRLRASLIEVEQSITTWPQLASSVAMGGGAASDVARKICLGEAVPSGRHYLDIDQLVPVAKAQESGGERCFRSRELTAERMLHAAGAAAPRSDRPSARLSEDAVCRLVGDAILAPSGGNCQPWKWFYDGNRLHVFHDRSRSRVPYDPQGCGSVLAIGCAVENLLLSAYAGGLRVRCRLFPQSETPELIATLEFCSNDSDIEELWRPELYHRLATRRTNRDLGNKQGLRADDKDALTAAVRSVPGAEIYWLEEEDDLRECANLVGRTDMLQLTSKPLHQFLVSEIRWTAEESDLTHDGIALDSLRLSPSDRAGFELCRDWSTLSIVREVGGGRNLQKSSRKAISSASAVGLVTAPAKTMAAFFSAGRAVERMWLTSTERALALHPMTSLPYLLAHAEERNVFGLEADTRQACAMLRPRYRRLFPVPDECAHALLFRISYAPQIDTPSVRRNVKDVLTVAHEP